MTRKYRSRKRKRFWRWVKRGGVVLGFLGVSIFFVSFASRQIVSLLERHRLEVAALQDELDKIDLLKAPEEYLALERLLSYKQSEPLLYVILALVFVVVIIYPVILSIQSIRKPKQQERREKPSHRPKRIRLDRDSGVSTSFDSRSDRKVS